MFLVNFLPKIFSFFLVPVYTTYLSTEEYGISDLIISTASLIAPVVALAIPNALLRFTIENKEDKRPYQISLRILTIGMSFLLLGLILVYLLFDIQISYLLFVFLIVGTSLLSDIQVSYARGQEQMEVITICGVGSSFVSIVSNILFIVVLKWGLYGFLFSSVAGYAFNIIVLMISNGKRHVLKGIYNNRETELCREMLGFSIPLIFSGLSWWVVSSSDRYFVAGMCGTAANGIYSVAYKIPTILQAFDNVFRQAWTFTLYDSYRTEDGKKYIARVYDVYSFVLCIGCSFLIAIDIILSQLLYANDFFEAWKYVPFLLISVVLNSASSLMSNFLSIYKKTKSSMNISIVAALVNIVLNWVLIIILDNPLGAAIATAITFFVSWCCNCIMGIKLSGVNIHWKKQLLTYLILCSQSIIIIHTKNMFMSGLGIAVIVIMNWNTVVWAKSKWKKFITLKI